MAAVYQRNARSMTRSLDASRNCKEINANANGVIMALTTQPSVPTCSAEWLSSLWSLTLTWGMWRGR
jgi:hypothetical protein